MDIPSPKHPANHDDYQIECEHALDMPLRDLVDMATVAGWLPDRIFDALASLIENQRSAYAEDSDPADDEPAPSA
jgi:hypothetical protein